MLLGPHCSKRRPFTTTATFDALGRPVRTFQQGYQAAGEQSLHLDLELPAGVYLLQLQAGQQLGTTRVVVQ
ncbi:MAG: T9SS type A sorting domain-containing protein [Lewinella sp.]|nr:T9SS type A sorting domain-containing protein [Lewinella sp.]